MDKRDLAEDSGYKYNDQTGGRRRLRKKNKSKSKSMFFKKFLSKKLRSKSKRSNMTRRRYIH